MALPVPSSPSRARPSSSDSDRRPAELEEADYFICDSEREEKAGEYSSFSLDEGESSSVGWSGAQKVERRRALRRNLSLGGLVVGAAVGGWLGGSTHAGERLLRTAGGGSLDFGTDDKLASTCNPYDQHGVLLVNLTVPSENMWQPVSAPESCQPVDFLSLLYAGGTQSLDPRLDFARNRTLVMYGDSVDRDHVEHFCAFAGGVHEMIGADHPLSPPYPVGQEIPPDGYKNFFTGARVWPSFFQSRPFVCHIARYNLRLLNVFHYGFRSQTAFLTGHAHFYPPATFEDRFSQIVLPLVASLAEKYGTSPTPDLLEITPGFWGIMRLGVDEGSKRVAPAASNPFQNMSQDVRDWLGVRMKAAFQHVAKGWLESGDVRDPHRRPKILYRALHHIKAQDSLPFTRTQSMDQIGRAVVEQLIAEGRAAQESDQSWLAWTKRTASYLGWKDDSRSAALEGGLGTRMGTDEWGSLMLGQENHFRDNVHPLPLPGSFLWGNIIMQQLKMAVEERERDLS